MSGNEPGFDRRVEQFRGYIEAMVHRADTVSGETCFLSFAEGSGSEGTGCLFGTVTGWPGRGRAPEERGKQREVHFAFEEGRFQMVVMSRAFSGTEREILRSREGFSRAGDDPGLRSLDAVADFSGSLEKSYARGQEREAAEDAAYVFFEVWKLPVDHRLYASADSLSGAHIWEQGECFK